ncbi:MAG: UbiH/UbiF/VisC/COQ6 family ubiquinone biosynthesis hydroxylase [Pseudomonadales bacterium]|jgi:2-octaprenylphenol hydroxylase|nr:UbiH/UbiF/VisC/COQ6 family ubiquinone biosynthesis hydroxylase [Pseudomonadales bacterium]
MQQHPDFDLIIAGGGMVGLAQALALADSPLRVALLDQRPPAPAPSMTELNFDNRVSALTPASAEFLRELGVWEALLELRLCPYTRMEVWDADGTGAIRFDARDLHLDALGYLVENSLVTAVLAEALRNTQIECRFGAAIANLERDSAGWRLALSDGASLTCSLLIGADGGGSRVREWAGLKTRAWSYGHEALVTTVHTEQPHRATAWQCFMRTGPLAFLPLRPHGDGSQHYSSIVWSCEPALARELLALDQEQFAARCATAFERRLGAVEVLSPVQAFPLRQLHAIDYVAPNLALIGDAAHTIHPLAGQGVNLGLADVHSLSGVIRAALAQGRDYCSQQTLSRYQRERKAANLGMMLGMEGFKRLFGSDDLLLRWLRNEGLRLADSLTPLKQTLMRRATGL